MDGRAPAGELPDGWTREDGQLVCLGCRRRRVIEEVTRGTRGGRSPTVWASPMAHQWLDADVDALRRLAWMIDTVNRGEGTAALDGEARQLEDRFGLSPVARRRLE